MQQTLMAALNVDFNRRLINSCQAIYTRLQHHCKNPTTVQGPQVLVGPRRCQGGQTCRRKLPSSNPPMCSLGCLENPQELLAPHFRTFLSNLISCTGHGLEEPPVFNKKHAFLSACHSHNYKLRENTKLRTHGLLVLNGFPCAFTSPHADHADA